MIIRSAVLIFFTLSVFSATTAIAGVVAVNAPIGGTGCDLIDAINSANNDVNEGGCLALNGYDDADTILLTRDQILTTTFTERNGLPAINSDITIDGDSLSDENEFFKIRRSDEPGTPSFRIFEVRDSGKLTLRSLEVSNGHLDPVDSGFIPGGGILVEQGELVLLDVALLDNFAQVGGALHILSSNARARIERSSFYNNRASNSGAAISIGPSSSVSIYDSTITGNHSDGFGAGIVMSAFATENQLAIYNTTISDNFAGTGGGIMVRETSTTVSNPSRTIIIRNSIISGNSHDSNANGEDILFGEEVFTSRYPTVTFDNNIVGQSENTSVRSIKNLANGLANNIIATSDGNRPTRLNDIIGSLSFSSKGVAYLPLVENSPAIDSGVPFRVFRSGPPPLNTSFFEPGCTGLLIGIGTSQPYRIDQIGTDRPIGNECDIGAIEYQPQEQCYVIPTANGKTVVFCL